MDYAKANGIDYIDLRSDRVTGKEFESVIKKKQPKLVIFNGHGNEEMVTGHKCSPLIQINKNEPLLINKIVYAISCKSAQKLGISCVKNGTLAYIGYNEDFIFVFDKTKTFDPSEDELARYLEVEASNILEWANSGKIPAFKEGNDWKFERPKIEDWIAKEKTK